MDKLVRVVSTTVRSIAKTYKHCGNLMEQIDQQLVSLESYLQLVLEKNSV